MTAASPYACDAARPVARFSLRLPRGGAPWCVDGGDWTLLLIGNVSISDAKAICQRAAAALRPEPER